MDPRLNDDTRTNLPAGVLIFHLNDADGDQHEYLVTPHNGDDGLSVVLRLMSVGIEPLARALEGALRELMNQGGVSTLRDIAALDLSSLAGSLAIADAAHDLSTILSRPDSADVIKSLLKHTTRDKRPLRTPTNFAEAYARNYVELLGVVWRVVQHNRFLPLFDIFSLDETP